MEAESLTIPVEPSAATAEPTELAPAGNSTGGPLEEPMVAIPSARRIAKGGLLLASLAMVSQSLGLAREGTISYFLGATGRADAYIAAYQPIEVLTNALLLSMPFAVIPFLVRFRERYSDATARWAIRRVQIAVVLALALLGVALLPVGAWVIHLSDPVLDGSQLQLSIGLWEWMLPSVILAGITAFFLAELIADHRFLCQGLNPILLNASIVIGGILGWRFLGVYGLAAGVLLGFSAQTLLQFFTVLRSERLFPTRPAHAPPVFREALTTMGPVFLLYLFGAFNQPIPRRFAAEFGGGSLAAFTYAMRVWAPVFMLGVLTISYPYFSPLVAVIARDSSQARRLVQSMLRSTLLFSLPAMAAVAILRYDIVRVLFHRGAFDARAAASVASTIAFLAPFLAGSLLADTLSRCLVAAHRMLAACGIYALMLVLIWAVATVMKPYGVHAIALGWAGCMYAGALGFYLAVARFVPGIADGLFGSLGKVALAGIASALAMFLLSHWMPSLTGGSLLNAILRIVITISVGLMVMALASYLLGVNELKVLINRKNVAR